MEEQELAVRAAVRIQRMVRGVQARGRVRRLVGDLFKRRMIIRELLETEENYIRDLGVVVSDFQVPLLSQGIISREEAERVFMNVDQIRRLNELFFVTIFEEAREYWHYKVIFLRVEREVHFFKMYFEYLNHYMLSSQEVDRLAARQPFADFLERARLAPAHRLLTLKDYLIKPVQRLPKYVLIMKEVKRRTPPDHPDYPNVCRVLALFEEVNHSNNEKLNRVVNSYKIREIEKKLMLPHVISEPGTEFVLEEPVTLISNDSQVVEATLYLLNTELIVARKSYQGQEKFMASVPFKNGGATIMENEDHYFYRNTFSVQNGEGDSCTFLCGSEEEREVLVQKIFNELMKAEQRTLEKLAVLCNVKGEGVEFLKKMSRLDLLPDVQILGTDERNDHMFKYTAYIVEVRIKSIRQKIFVRFSELLALQEDLKKDYGLALKNELLKTTWVTNHKPKKIQERKMAIQRFLKEVLAKQEIIEHGQDVLYRLGLPSDFYRLPDIYKDSENILRKSAYQRSTSDLSEEDNCRSVIKGKRVSIFENIPEMEGRESRKGRERSRLSIQDILKANELHLGHFTRYTQIMNPRSKQAETYSLDVLIPWLQNEKGYVRQGVEIQKEERVLTLIELLARKIGLKYFKDFRVVLERDFAGRMLDDDECLAKVVEEVRSGKYLMVFKKVIYVATELEEREFRTDRVRLKIIASQVIYDCKQDKYPLDYQSILRLAVLIAITRHCNEAQLPSKDQGNNDRESIQKRLYQILCNKKVALSARSMVTSAYTSFYDSTATWVEDYQKMLPVMLSRLSEISSGNAVVFRSSGVSDREKEHNTTDVGQLAAISIIGEMKEKVFFGAVCFVVQMSQWMREWLRRWGEGEEGEEGDRNCWLVVRYDSMHLYSISLAHRIFSFDYQQLYKMEPSPSSIRLHLRDREIDYLKLKTNNSYSIRQMLLYYKNYNDILHKMEEDENFEHSMIELVREENRESHLRQSFYNPQ